MDKRKVAIIGAGASGMMAAVTAGTAGADVTIFEHGDSVGKKLLQTGNGKCNFTNVSMGSEFYHTSGDPRFIDKLINRFDNEDVIKFFSSLGVYTRNRKGGIYPYPETASAVNDVLKMELKRLGIDLVFNCHDIVLSDDLKISGEQFDSIIIAAGGCTAKNTGSDGSGYKMARSLGLSIVPVLPALTPLITFEELGCLTGIRCEASMKLISGDKTVSSSRGELQPYEKGLSGICALDLSSDACRLMHAGNKVYAEVDFFPDFDDDVFRQFIEYRIKSYPDRNINEIFTGIFHKKLTHFLLSGLDCRDNDFMDRLLISVKHHRFQLSEDMCNDYSRAQTVSGGISLDEFDENCMLKRHPGIYAAGEIMDVDGICGGYNLQWAWCSGHAAGIGAAL